MKKLLPSVFTILFSIAVTAQSIVPPSVSLTKAPLKIADELALFESAGSDYKRGATGLVYEKDFVKKGSSYIKLRFEGFDLAPGDYVEISNPITGQTHVYALGGAIVDRAGNMNSDFWSASIFGDHATVKLFSQGVGNHDGFEITKVAYGYPEEQIEKSIARSLCGDDDREQVICYNGNVIYDKARAVCRVIIGGGGLCTGWLLGSAGHVMTNNHCIGNATSAQGSEFQFNYENTDCAGTMPAVVDQITGSTLVCTDGPLDYTLVELSSNPTPTHGYLQFRVTPPTVGERIYIPQHPGGRRKEVAVFDDQQGSGFAEVTDAGNRVEYLCDTEGGSSGSPVLGWNDNLVVALHNTGGCPNGGNRNNNIIADMGSCLPPDAIGNVTAPPTSNFSSSVNCLTVDFNDLSTNFPNAWYWDFGDGDTAVVQNPTHTYTSYGTYDITLIASNTNGPDTIVVLGGIVLGPDAPPSVDTVYICSADSAILNATGSSSYNWYSDAAGTTLLGSGFSYQTGLVTSDSTFYVSTAGACASTIVPIDVVVAGNSAAPDSTFGAIGCEGDQLTLSAFGSGDILWYGQASGGQNIASGNTFNTGVLNNTQDYWVAAGFPTTVIDKVGPLDASFGGGGHQNFTNRLVFDALEDVTIVSAWVDAGSADDRTFAVFNQAGNVIATTTVFIPAGQGRVTLNLVVPQGNDYEIGTNGGTIDMYRNNDNVSYPYTSDYVEITSSTAGNAGGFYYYLYDWEVQANGYCEGPRVQVSAIINPNPLSTLFVSGATMDAGSGFASYQWYWNGNALSGATLQAYTAVVDGNYYCVVTNANGCEAQSNTVPIITQSVGDELDRFGFSMWPNPVQDELNIELGVQSADLEIYSIDGRLVHRERVSQKAVISTVDFVDGAYLVQVTTTQGSRVQRLVVR